MICLRRRWQREVPWHEAQQLAHADSGVRRPRLAPVARAARVARRRDAIIHLRQVRAALAAEGGGGLGVARPWAGRVAVLRHLAVPVVHRDEVAAVGEGTGALGGARRLRRLPLEEEAGVPANARRLVA
jgi:hypothetical protein